MSTTALKLSVEPIEGGDPVVVLAGMVEGRQWERANGRSIAKELEASPTVVVELAHLAYRRRHGVDLSLDEFEEKFDVDVVSGGSAPAVPSDPATAPPSD